MVHLKDKYIQTFDTFKELVLFILFYNYFSKLMKAQQAENWLYVLSYRSVKFYLFVVDLHKSSLSLCLPSHHYTMEGKVNVFCLGRCVLVFVNLKCMTWLKESCSNNFLSFLIFLRIYIWCFLKISFSVSLYAYWNNYLLIFYAKAVQCRAFAVSFFPKMSIWSRYGRIYPLKIFWQKPLKIGLKQGWKSDDMGVMREKWGRRREGDKGDLVHHLPSYVSVFDTEIPGPPQRVLARQGQIFYPKIFWPVLSYKSILKPKI